MLVELPPPPLLATEAPSGLGAKDPYAGWALLPEELAAHSRRPSEGLFRRLQRPWSWAGARGPTLGRHTAEWAWHTLELPEVMELLRAQDGSTKLILRLAGSLVELVHMPRAVGEGRVTLCVSSQVGCAMGCAFCATASMGFGRHLTAGEMVAQVLLCLRRLGPRHPGQLTLVFMGMGEPLHNLTEVARAVRVLCHPGGLGLSPRRITISTSGLVPEIDALARFEPRPLLAVSLNATSDAQRSELMPVNRRYPLSTLREALERFPLRPRERLTLEYVLLAGVNDSDEDADRLLEFSRNLRCHVNLIPFNEHPHAPFRAPSEARLTGFMQRLVTQRRLLVTVRHSRGRDVQAACGQLVTLRTERRVSTARAKLGR